MAIIIREKVFDGKPIQLVLEDDGITVKVIYDGVLDLRLLPSDDFFYIIYSLKIAILKTR